MTALDKGTDGGRVKGAPQARAAGIVTIDERVVAAMLAAGPVARAEDCDAPLEEEGFP